MTAGPPRFGRKARIALLLVGAGVAAWLLWPYRPMWPAAWTADDLAALESLSLGSLGEPPVDASNTVSDDPGAVALGSRLFFDTRFSANGAVSCATCHQPDRQFTDGLQKGRGVGTSGRNTRSIIGSAYSPWQYWDGRRDSLWAQALSPLEDRQEHASNRMRIVRLVAQEETYRRMYEQLFGTVPDFSDTMRFPDDAGPVANEELERSWRQMAGKDRQAVNRMFANIGKAIAAYERTLVPEPTRFDGYVSALLDGDEESANAWLDDEEVMGLQLFMGKARCTECHNGPLLTNNEFHNTGILTFPGELPDRGRVDGARLVKQDPFNCLGPFSDDPDRSCPELVFMREGSELIGATRTPSLRNVAETAPYMHKGQLATLEEVIDHYNEASDAMIGHNEAEPLSLDRREKKQLLAFLKSLSPGQ